MKISVIMLTYNREQLVGRAIESILAQTMTDFEFIIVDNGSTDRSGAVTDEYAARDSRLSGGNCPPLCCQALQFNRIPAAFRLVGNQFPSEIQPSPPRKTGSHFWEFLKKLFLMLKIQLLI